MSVAEPRWRKSSWPSAAPTFAAAAKKGKFDESYKQGFCKGKWRGKPAGTFKAKVRAGDTLGALTGDGGIEGSQVGKINVMDFMSYVAVVRAGAIRAEEKLGNSKIKRRRFKVKKL